MKEYKEYYDLLLQELNSWIEALVTAIPNIIVALIITILFALFAFLLSNLAAKVMGQISHSKVLIGLTRTFVKVLVLILGFIIALGVHGLQKAVFSILAGAGVLGLALGFAFQDLAANFLAGVFMAFRNPFSIGDVIKTNDYIGTVTNMNLRNTIIKNFDGQVVIIPNKEVFENPLINYSVNGKRRIHLVVGVAYSTDLESATQTLEKTLEELNFIDKEQGIKTISSEFGDSAINIDVYYWIKYPDGADYLASIDSGVKAIKSAFDKKGINIPFPIRTLDFSLSSEQALQFESKNDTPSN